MVKFHYCRVRYLERGRDKKTKVSPTRAYAVLHRVQPSGISGYKPREAPQNTTTKELI